MTPTSLPNAWDELAARCRPRVEAELNDSIVPFWWRTIDRERGGVFNCWDNCGRRLVRRDKFTWSQGRFAWMCARLAEGARTGLIAGDAEEFLGQAEKTVAFLRRHAFLADGRCAFLLSEDGEVRELQPGMGLAPSIYADCFVVMGTAECARVSGRRELLEVAWQLFLHIEARLEKGGFPTHPDPIPDGCDSHAIAMIWLNVALVMEAALAQLQDARAGETWARAVAGAERVFTRFMQPGGEILELLPRRAEDADTLLARHVNPGHALEGLWMLLTVAEREGRADWLQRAGEAVNRAFQLGWDEKEGGVLYYVDREGGEPHGRASSAARERSVRSAWSHKLWWVHSEAIYTALLCYRLTGDAETGRWFERVFDYALRVFPNADRAVGEWIQIRDRAGRPIEQVVALPVKDPYHVTRNLLQVLELFSACKAT